MGFQRGDSPFGRGLRGQRPLIITAEVKIDLRGKLLKKVFTIARKYGIINNVAHKKRFGGKNV